MTKSVSTVATSSSPRRAAQNTAPIDVPTSQTKPVNPDGSDAPVKVKLLKNVRVHKADVNIIREED